MTRNSTDAQRLDMVPAVTLRSINRGSWSAHIVGVVAALLLGFASGQLAAAVVAAATLLPVVAHVRHVGLRRAIAEPSAVTIIVGFYLLVFPLRGLVIAARGYTDVFLARGPVSGHDLSAELLLASFATTALVEAYYFVIGPRRLNTVTPHHLTPRAPDRRSGRLRVTSNRPAARHPARIEVVELFDAGHRSAHRPSEAGVVALAGILAAIAYGALLGVLVQYGGVSGAQGAFLSHSKAAALQGATTISTSAWEIFAAPAVWCAACVAVNAAQQRIVRSIFVLGGLVIILAQLVVFGSRLNAIGALIGAWIVFYYSGRVVPVKGVVVAIPVLILLSVPIISQRSGGNDVRLPAIERYSRIAGYDVLDASLAVRQDPSEIRGKLLDPQRWFDLPAYFVPASVWHGRPNIETRRLDLYVAQTLGTVNDQATGFPTTYVTESWLYAGWPAVLFMSVIFGALLGWLHRKLIIVSRGRPSPAALLSYCFIVTLAFNYYKDGDVLLALVGNWRAAVYLGLAMLATGVWRPSRQSLDRTSPRLAATVSS